jgi:hypothetical protein
MGSFAMQQNPGSVLVDLLPSMTGAAVAPVSMIPASTTICVNEKVCFV